jgi:hypothetical protein
MQPILLVLLGTIVIVAAAASRAPGGFDAGMSIVALGTGVLASRVRRRRRFPWARVERLIRN